MINIRTLKKLNNNDGLTLKGGKVITHKSGWQVATVGKQTTSVHEAMQYVKYYNGNCGVWLSDGIYYVDSSRRCNTKKEALSLGKQFNQISILKWANLSLVYC